MILIVGTSTGKSLIHLALVSNDCVCVCYGVIITGTATVRGTEGKATGKGTKDNVSCSPGSSSKSRIIVCTRYELFICIIYMYSHFPTSKAANSKNTASYQPDLGDE